MGDDLAIDGALHYPDRIGGLIVGGVTHRLPENYFASLQWMGLEGPGLVNFERAQENIPELVAVWQAEHVQSPSHWQDLVTEVSYEMVNPTLPAEDELRSIAHPTLIVWGDRDQFLPVENAVDLYHLLPNAQLAVVPGADHFVTRTRVALFAGFVKVFLRPDQRDRNLRRSIGTAFYFNETAGPAVRLCCRPLHVCCFLP